MTYKDQILEIIASGKMHVIHLTKKIPGAWNWVETNCEPKLLTAPLGYCRREFAMIYSAAGLATNSICSYGNLRTFSDEKKFKNCILGKACPCYFEKYRDLAWQSKAISALEKREATNRSKFGYENTAQSPILREKFKTTCIEKYGVDNPKKNEAVKLKGQKTNLARYGDIHATRSDIVKQHTRATNLKKYGTESYNQIEAIKGRQHATLMKNYGVDNAIHVPGAMIKREQTNLREYGAKSCSGLPWVQLKRRRTSLDNCFRPSAAQTHITDENFAILQDPGALKTLIEAHGFMGAAKELGIAFSTLYIYHKKYNLQLFTASKSSAELEISNWLENLQVKYNLNDRTVFRPSELDFYIPGQNLALEFDGIYWHSEKQCKDSTYHLSKTTRCAEQGIQLIHIFEDEWLNKKDICKSIIASRLGIVSNKIQARKCSIVELSNVQIKQFVNENHLQGHVTGKVNLGMQTADGELVAAMTFGKPRYNKSAEWELLRLVIKKNTQVIGGIDKLWSYFQKTYSPKSIISYCDRRWFSGDVYARLKFKLLTKGKPTYWYTDYKQRFHRSRFQKHKLVAMGHDATLTEAIITRDVLGLDRIWDCGQDSWLWKLNK